MKTISALFVATLFATSVSSAHAAPPSCELTFKIGTSTQLVSASVFAIYQNAPGSFPGANVAVDCDLLNGIIGQAADADETRTLTLTVAGTPNAIKGPVEFAKCTWIPTSRFPTAGDFNLSGQSGFSTAFQPVNANITISKINCTGTIATTTTSTSSTSTSTLPPAPLCGDFDDNGKVQSADALAVLRTAVGQRTCDLCVCDVTGNGSINAGDALVVLKMAIGLTPATACPAC